MTDGTTMSSQRAVTDRVLEAVAQATGEDLLSLPPLYEAVDADALDALYTQSTGPQSRTAPTVRFRYAGQTVVVRSATDVVVQ